MHWSGLIEMVPATFVVSYRRSTLLLEGNNRFKLVVHISAFPYSLCTNRAKEAVMISITPEQPTN